MPVACNQVLFHNGGGWVRLVSTILWGRGQVWGCCGRWCRYFGCHTRTDKPMDRGALGKAQNQCLLNRLCEKQPGMNEEAKHLSQTLAYTIGVVRRSGADGRRRIAAAYQEAQRLAARQSPWIMAMHAPGIEACLEQFNASLMSGRPRN